MKPIDAGALKDNLTDIYGNENRLVCLKDVLDLIGEQPTLTQPNEALTLIRMNEELPPDNERVLVYRPCMETADTGPWDVQWGWSAKRDGSHWAHLNRRPPEGLEAAKTIVDFCEQQPSCQNCIFRMFGGSEWKCHIEAFDLRGVLSNIAAKNKNRGYI